MADTGKKLNWRDLVAEQEKIEPDGYVLYLRRSLSQKKGKDDDEPRGRIDNISIEQQREACKYIAKTRKLRIVETFEEEIPAKIPNKRPEFKKMLDYLKNSKEKLGILAWDVARVSRNALEAGIVIQMYLEKHIIDFQFATFYFNQDDTSVEYLMMEFARAMGYSLRLRKNVLRAMHENYFDFQEWQFPDKFGYQRLKKTKPDGERRKVNFLIPHEPKNGERGEFEAVQTAFKLRLQEKTFEEISKYINSIGFISKKGTKIVMTQQRLCSLGKTRIGILKDPFYMGTMKSKFGESDIQDSTEIDDDGNLLTFIPVVTKTEFLKCQEVNNKQSSKQTKTHDHLPFRGMIKCGHCKETMTPETKNKKGKEHVFYYCHNQNCDGGKMHSQSGNKKVRSGITGVELFETIKKILKEGFKLDKKAFTTYLVHLEKKRQLKKALKKSDLKSIQAKKGHIETLKNDNDANLFKAMAESKSSTQRDVITEQHEKIKTGLVERMNELLEQEKKIIESDTSWTQEFKEWLELTQKAHLYWEKATLAQKKVLAQNIFFELIVENGKLASYKCKEPYETFEKANLYYNGGR